MDTFHSIPAVTSIAARIPAVAWIAACIPAVACSATRIRIPTVACNATRLPTVTLASSTTSASLFSKAYRAQRGPLGLGITPAGIKVLALGVLRHHVHAFHVVYSWADMAAQCNYIQSISELFTQ